jgi:hypothetical protein
MIARSECPCFGGVFEAPGASLPMMTTEGGINDEGVTCSVAEVSATVARYVSSTAISVRYVCLPELY